MNTGTAENNWIKLYESVLDDPDLQEMPAENFRLLVNCWLLAHRYGNKLGTIRQISFRLHMDQAFVAEAMANLKDYFKCSDGTYVVAKWDVWQTTQTSTDRARRSRERKKQENTPPSCNSFSDATFATPATIATIDAAAATFATNAVAPATIATIEKKRKEENRKEESVAATAATPPAPQPAFPEFGDEPDPTAELNALAVEIVGKLPAGGSVSLTAKALEYKWHASGDDIGTFCAFVRSQAEAWRKAWDENPDIRRNAAQFWIGDGDYKAKAPQRALVAQAGQKRQPYEATKPQRQADVCKRCAGTGSVMLVDFAKAMSMDRADDALGPCPECRK